jgi:hypothetical protein
LAPCHSKKIGDSKVKLSTLALGLLFAASPAFAAEIDGKWTGSLDTPNGPVAVAYTFKADGATLTGSTETPDGMSLPISAGKIEGNKISFDFTVDFGGGPTTFKYTGELVGPDLKLQSSFMDMPFEFTLKKS